MAKSYGVSYLTKKLKLSDDTYTRTKLRNAGVAKNKDGVYAWDSQAAADKVAAKISAPAKTEKKPAKKSKARPAKEDRAEA